MGATPPLLAMSQSGPLAPYARVAPAQDWPQAGLTRTHSPVALAMTACTVAAAPIRSMQVRAMM